MNKSKLLIISGLPGSGKSTVAESLAEKLSVPIISVDPIESSIIKSGIKRSFETELAAYLVAEALAGEQLKRGLSVIIDAVSPVQEARDMWHNLARKHKATLIIIECVLDRELHKKRIESRILLANKSGNVNSRTKIPARGISTMDDTAPWASSSMVEIPLAGILGAGWLQDL